MEYTTVQSIMWTLCCYSHKYNFKLFGLIETTTGMKDKYNKLLRSIKIIPYVRKVLGQGRPQKRGILINTLTGSNTIDAFQDNK